MLGAVLKSPTQAKNKRKVIRLLLELIARLFVVKRSYVGIKAKQI